MSRLVTLSGLLASAARIFLGEATCPSLPMPLSVVKPELLAII